jgi:hypothetical protein
VKEKHFKDGMEKKSKGKGKAGTDLGQVAEEQPEDITLVMPSTLESEKRDKWQLSEVAAEELALRKGEADDCLAELRLSLGHKALLLRTRVRNSKSQNTKTKSWDAVHRITVTVNKCVRGYGRARAAIIHLGANSQTKERYKKLKKEHLGLSGDVQEGNRYGQKSDKLAWFWRRDGGSDKKDNWMEECEF